jgi:hypothetical protein
MEAVVRPSDWELPLFVHVGGAMVLVGALVVALTLSMASLRRADGGSAQLTRLAYRTLLLAGIPALIAMRVGAEWVVSQEDWGDPEPAWIGVGYMTADLGVLLVIIATVLAWRATKRGDNGPGRLGAWIVGLSSVVLVAYVVAIWAMTTKPD